MGFVFTVTAGLLAWIVLWSLGAKGWDGFMVTIAIVLLGVTGRMLARYLPNRAD